MATIFISDIHLDVSHPHLLRLFEYFIDNIAAKADTLYILGDLFETWIGDDDKSTFNTQIAKRIASLKTKNVTVYFMKGNRDFLVGEIFCREAGMILLEDYHLTTICGQKYLLSHGDMFCINDIAYQKYREKIQNPKTIQRILRLPLFLRRLIAAYLRKKSQASQANRMTGSDTLFDVNFTVISALMRQENIDRLIHGHTHRPAIALHYEENRLRERYVLSDWGQQGNYLLLNDDGQMRLNYFEI